MYLSIVNHNHGITILLGRGELYKVYTESVGDIEGGNLGWGNRRATPHLYGTYMYVYT